MSPIEIPKPYLEKVVAGNKKVILVKDDLTLLEVDAIVFYAREDLKLGSGYGTAISVRGGPKVQEELDHFEKPVTVGDAVVTTAANLKARYIIHAVGPKFQEPNLEGKLTRTVQKCLQLAKVHNLKTMAFPPMGYGFYGVPLDLCARVMSQEIGHHLRGETSLETCMIAVVDTRVFEAFRPHVERLG